MKQTKFLKVLSFVLCIVLVAAMALCTTACSDNKNAEQETVQTTAAPNNSVKELGEGAKSFSFSVVDKDGNKTAFLINTDKTTVGDALLELDLIAGDESEYGLYVKTVNGVTLDYDKDQMYWAFFVNGEYATSGVDTTDIDENAEYKFEATKG